MIDILRPARIVVVLCSRARVFVGNLVATNGRKIGEVTKVGVFRVWKYIAAWHDGLGYGW